MTREENDKNMAHLMKTMDTIETDGLQGVSQAYRASCDVEKAHIEHEMKMAEIEAQKEIARKQRVVDHTKIWTTVALGVLGAVITIWNTIFVSNQEHGKNPEKEAIIFRSKGWLGLKPFKTDTPRL